MHPDPISHSHYSLLLSYFHEVSGSPSVMVMFLYMMDFSTFLKNFFFLLSMQIKKQLSYFCLILQKRKAESVSLATQVTAVTPVPSIPGSAEASQASVYPTIRDSTFSIKSRDEHEPLTSLTTVRNYFKKKFFLHNNNNNISSYYLQSNLS